MREASSHGSRIAKHSCRAPQAMGILVFPGLVVRGCVSLPSLLFSSFGSALISQWSFL